MTADGTVATDTTMTADADAQTLARLGVRGAVPSESTFRRTLQRLNADAFDDLAGRWAAQRTAPGPRERRLDGGSDEQRGLRVDGDVPAEQHAADDLPCVPGCVLETVGHVSLPS